MIILKFNLPIGKRTSSRSASNEKGRGSRQLFRAQFSRVTDTIILGHVLKTLVLILKFGDINQ